MSSLTVNLVGFDSFFKEFAQAPSFLALGKPIQDKVLFWLLYFNGQKNKTANHFKLSAQVFSDKSINERHKLRSFVDVFVNGLIADLVENFNHLGDFFIAKLRSYLCERVSFVIDPSLAYYRRESETAISIKKFSELFPYHYELSVHIVDGIAVNVKRCIDRLENDISEYPDFFKGYSGMISDMDFMDSDPHNGQQTVICVNFSNGKKLIYKPRPLDGEEYLNNILNAISANVETPATISILNRSEYGWMEWLDSPKTLTVTSEVVARQLGTLLAIATTAALSDLHCENVLLRETGICVIDAEAINVRYPDLGQGIMFKNPNVLEIGILPSPQGSMLESWWDLSLLGVTPGISTSPLRFRFDGEILRVEYHVIPKRHAHIRAVIDDFPMEKVLYLIQEGFLGATKVLAGLDPMSPSGSFRYIHRPTAVYHRTLMRLTDTSFNDIKALVNELATYLADLVIHSGKLKTYDFSKIVSEEIVSLFYGDIPRLDSKALNEAFFQDIQPQIWNLPHKEFSLSAIQKSLKLKPIKISEKFELANGQDYKDPLETFRSIAGIIANNVLLTDGRIYGINSVQSIIPRLSSLNISFYNGQSGLLIPLGIAVISGYREFEYLFKDIVTSIFVDIQNNRSSIIGNLSDGSLGIMYALSFLRKIAEGDFLDYINEQLGRFFDLTKDYEFHNEQSDVVSGKAGVLLALLSLHSEIKTAKIHKVIDCIINELLVNQTEKGAWYSLNTSGLCGFSHGAAGIRYALAVAMTQGYGIEKKIRKSMAKALSFEQGHYSDEAFNWYDLRFPLNHKQRKSNFSAWCHGAAGIALAEISIGNIGLYSYEERILPALSAKNQDNGRSSICCGSTALHEVKRMLLQPVDRVDTHILLHQEELNSPTSLFKASWGSKLLALDTKMSLKLGRILLVS